MSEANTEREGLPEHPFVEGREERPDAGDPGVEGTATVDSFPTLASLAGIWKQDQPFDLREIRDSWNEIDK